METKRFSSPRKDIETKKLIANQLSLTKNQINYFDRFLVASTSKVLNAVETMVALEIDSSHSSLEIMPAVNIEKLEPLCSEPLFVISSGMMGELQGGLHLLMRSSDFKTLGEVMKPILKLLFLSDSDTDLTTLESQQPDWMKDDQKPLKDDPAFHGRMMDVLTELGNVLFGIYTKAVYVTFDLHTNHSLPESSKDTDQQYIQQILSSPALLYRQHLVIENEFSILNKTFKLWCLISPERKSFQEILNRTG
jgi:chemotaxis protein CheY-P-specific phosphatase CheC